MRTSGNNWEDQQIKENDGSFVSTNDISKFQKFGIRVCEGWDDADEGLPTDKYMRKVFERLKMTRIVRVIQKTQGIFFEE